MKPSVLNAITTGLILQALCASQLDLNQTEACSVTGIQWCDNADSIQQWVIECTVDAADLEHGQQPQNLNTIAMLHSESRKKVSITCDVPATFTTIIFCVSACSGTSPPEVVNQKLENFTTNWQSKLSQESLILTKISKGLETLMINFQVSNQATTSTSLSLGYTLFDESYKPLYHGALLNKVTRIPTKFKRASASGNIVSGYLVVANRLYLHHINVDGSRSKVAVSGLGNAVGVDFHFRNNSLFWTDSSQQAIMKSTLEGLKKNTVINHGLTQPESLSVDWISSKLYWIDVRERQIGVLDLVRQHYKFSLISTDPDVNPRGLAVDPTTQSLYWTEWNRSIARIQKASMDGNGIAILFQNNLQRPYAISVDFIDQVLYWADAGLDRIESANVDGSNRRVVISSGLDEPYDLTLLGDMIYVSDTNLGILAANKSGAQPVEVIYSRFCEHVGPVGIQAVAQERQLFASSTCENNNGGCSHLCLLSSTDSRGFSCACPDEMTLHNDNITCSQSQINMTPANSTEGGSCRLAGFRSCCTSNICHSSSLCYCDSDCYCYGDCCEDIEENCSPQNESNAYLLVSNILYMHRVSMDGTRIKTVYSTNSMESIIAVDYDYRANNMYWSTSNENRIWQSRLDGSRAIPFHIDDVHTIDDIAIDWISSKLYWTDNGPTDRIRVLDIKSGYYTSLIDTGHDTSPRAIIVDPINRYLYWSDWGSIAKIERASMDGKNRTVIHNTDLIWPNGLTLDHSQQILYWNDANRDRIESSRVDGSNRRIVSSQRIYKPFGISVYRNRLYFTDFSTGVNTIPLVNGVGSASTILDSLCENSVGIEVVSIERQPAGTNPCVVGNGGCSHLCLLSSMNTSGYSCACPDNMRLSEDAHTCFSNSTVQPVTPFVGHGTCTAAGYTGGCCTSGTCRGSPPTCSCDSACHLFQDCCVDVPPSCQPAIDVLEFATIPSNASVILGAQIQQIHSQFHCSVQASRVTNFEWTFSSKSHPSSTQSTLHQISNELGSVDVKYSVVSTDYASTLTIEGVQFSDAGVYTCIASIGGTLEPIEASAHLIVEVFPSVSEISGNIVYNSQQTISLSCQVAAYPQPTIVWAFKTETKIWNMLNTSRISVHSTYLTIEDGRPFSRSRLAINNANSNDSGDYLCFATAANNHITVQSRAHSITVAKINRCEDPQPPCLNGATCINHDQGYSCICSSAYMGENCSQRMETNYPLIKPSFINLTTTDELIIDFGYPLTLPCQAEGNPIPMYEWYKDGILIPGAIRPYLLIHEALPDERGNYSCKATNSEGTIESDSTRVSIPGIDRYVAVLECNVTVNISEEALTLIANPSYLNTGHGIIVSMEIKADQSNTSENVQILVTVLTKQMSQHFEIRKLLTLELARVCPVRSVIRFDGCTINQQTDLDIGESIEVPCPCHEYLEIIPGVKDQKASRVCGGTYRYGAHLLDTDMSQCSTIVSGATQDLCFAAMEAHEYPLEALLYTLNSTADGYQPSSIAEITLLSSIIEVLAAHAPTNPMIRDGFLTLMDYFQGLDHEMVAVSQDLTNSSTRVLNSLERFALTANHDRDLNGNNTVTKYAYQSYGIVLVDANTQEFQGQTLRAKLNKDNVTNITNWSMMLDFGPESNNLTVDDSIAVIHLPQQSLNDCTAAMDTQRVAFVVFRSGILFSSAGDNQEDVGSAVIAARINCTLEKTPAPITVIFNVSDQSDSMKSCASWLEGLWSTVSCKNSSEFSNGLMKCECHTLSYFGVIITSPSAAIKVQVYTYFAIGLSGTLLLLAFGIGVISTCQNFSSLEGIILIVLSLTLMFKYILFILGAHVTSIPALCGVNSGLLHYATLVFFSWTMVYSLWVYLSLFIFCGWSRQSKMILIKVMMLFSLILPLLIVAITAGVWSYHYTNSYFCGVIDQPLYFGLILPLAIVCVMNFVLVVLNLSKINRYHRELSTSNPTDSPRSKFGTTKARYSITIITTTFITFYIGLIFWLLSTHPRLQNYSTFVQIAFALVTVAQGPLLFIYALCSISNVRTLWIWKVFCCKLTRISTIDVSIADLPPTTDTSAHSSQAAMFAINENSKYKGSKTIPTDTNPAYESVMLRRKREEYTMTKNELYGNLN